MIKRLFDILSATLGLLFLFPCLLIIAVLIKITSPGPVFYMGTRTGRNRCSFRIIKFRTMVLNAEDLGGGSTAKNDPRITQIGRFLRRYKLDELPQLLNVLRGEMSIVGPRPELPKYTAEYKEDELVILSVRPGITDYASIQFSQLGDILGNDDPDRVYEEIVRPVKNALRIKYVREMCLANDLKIIFHTLVKLSPVRRS